MKPSFANRSPRYGARKTSKLESISRRGCRLIRRYSIFIALWLVLIPFIWSTLEWRVDDRLYRSYVPPESRTSPPQSFDTVDGPLISSSVYQPSSTHPLQVVYIGGFRMAEKEDEKGGDSFEILGNMLPSLQLSKYIGVVCSYLYSYGSGDLRVQEFSPIQTSAPVVYIVDWSALQRDCHVLDRILKQSKFQDGHSTLVLIDTSGSTRIKQCSRDAYMVKSSIVDNRRWDFVNQWVIGGNLLEAPVSRLTGYVAENFVDKLRAAEDSERTIDVAHYWSSVTIDNDIPNLQFSALRRAVSTQIKATHQRLEQKASLGAWVDEIGIKSIPKEKTEEEKDVVEETATTLSSAKIVVVAQNDEWEYVDNRLMEALASGALVMSDAMVAHPPDLVHKSNIIFYDSAKSLDTLLEYYLTNDKKRQEIARRGQKYALGRHRAWHAFEALLFGKAMTRKDKGLAMNPVKPPTMQGATVRFEKL